MKRSGFKINLILRSAMVATPLLFAVSVGAQATPNESGSNARADVAQQGQRQAENVATENQNGQQLGQPELPTVREQPTEIRTAAAVAYSDAWLVEVENLGDE